MDALFVECCCFCNNCSRSLPCKRTGSPAWLHQPSGVPLRPTPRRRPFRWLKHEQASLVNVSWEFLKTEPRQTVQGLGAGSPEVAACFQGHPLKSVEIVTRHIDIGRHSKRQLRKKGPRSGLAIAGSQVQGRLPALALALAVKREKRAAFGGGRWLSRLPQAGKLALLHLQASCMKGAPTAGLRTVALAQTGSWILGASRKLCWVCQGTQRELRKVTRPAPQERIQRYGRGEAPSVRTEAWTG